MVFKTLNFTVFLILNPSDSDNKSLSSFDKIIVSQLLWFKELPFHEGVYLFSNPNLLET